MRRQTTVNVGGQAIKVVVSSKSRAGNIAGFKAVVSDNQGRLIEIDHINTPDYYIAFEKAYLKFVTTEAA